MGPSSFYVTVVLAILLSLISKQTHSFLLSTDSSARMVQQAGRGLSALRNLQPLHAKRKTKFKRSPNPTQDVKVCVSSRFFLLVTIRRID